MDVNLRSFARISVASLVVALAVGCGGDDEPPEGTVGVELSEFAIEATATSVDPGEVTFDVENAGEALHEFVVVETPLGADELPTDDEGNVDEEGGDLVVVDEVEDLAAGDAAELSVELSSGHHVLLCNLPGHYAQGMHADLDVS